MWASGDAASSGQYLDFRTGSGIAYAAATVSDVVNNDAVAVLTGVTGVTFTEDQYIEGEIQLTYDPSGGGINHELGFMLRCTLASGSCYAYECYSNPTSGPAIARWNGASYSVEQLSTTDLGFVPYESGQILRAEVVGNTISFYQTPVAGSQTLICQYTDSSAERISLVSPGGRPGLESFPRTGASLAGLGSRSIIAGPI